MSLIAKALFTLCNLEAMTVSLAEMSFFVKLPAHTIIQEVEARGFSVVR